MTAALPPNADAEDRRVAILHAAWPVMYGYLARRGVERQLLEDLMQESAADLTSTWRTAGPLDEADAIAIMVNSAKRNLVDHWRKQRRRRTDPVAIDEEFLIAAARRAPVGEDEILTLLGRLTAEQMLGVLTFKERQALVAVYLDDLPQHAAAECFSISVTALQNRLNRAKSKLRTSLGVPTGTPVPADSQAPTQEAPS
ncbi:MAG: RNA polymerase sigma factor [Actinomycetota bacterium]|nr:RNA polymerase sigma factor [Actinomycetota bacterium]